MERPLQSSLSGSRTQIIGREASSALGKSMRCALVASTVVMNCQKEWDLALQKVPTVLGTARLVS